MNEWKRAITIIGYIGTTIRIHSFIPSSPEASDLSIALILLVVSREEGNIFPLIIIFSYVPYDSPVSSGNADHQGNS